VSKKRNLAKIKKDMTKGKSKLLEGAEKERAIEGPPSIPEDR